MKRIIDGNGNIEVYLFDEDPATRNTIATATRVFMLGERDVLDYGEVWAKVTVEKIKETEKAIQFRFCFIEDDEIEDDDTAWLPKSQIAITEDGYEIPEWLSQKNRLGKYTVRKMVIEDRGPLGTTVVEWEGK
jgi:hypothetical protein